MTDKELYKATFAHLRASGSGTRQEERRMKQEHTGKGAVVAGAAAALTVTAAGAANVATDGALLENIRVMFTGEVTDTQLNPDGSTTYSIKGDDGSDIEVTLPQEGEDGSTGMQFSVEGEAGTASYDITVDEANHAAVANRTGVSAGTPESSTGN